MGLFIIINSNINLIKCPRRGLTHCWSPNPLVTQKRNPNPEHLKTKLIEIDFCRASRTAGTSAGGAVANEDNIVAAGSRDVQCGSAAEATLLLAAAE